MNIMDTLGLYRMLDARQKGIVNAVYAGLVGRDSLLDVEYFLPCADNKTKETIHYLCKGMLDEE